MKPVNEFVAYCCELMSGAGVCISKRMFGGWGLSTEGLTIALIINLGEDGGGLGERLYLKADEHSIHQFEAAFCQPFSYKVKGQTRRLNYYTAPEEAMESAQAMRPWALLALDAALRARAPKMSRRKTALSKSANHVATKSKAPQKPAKS